MNTNQRNTISGAEDLLHTDQQAQSEPITPAPYADGNVRRSSPKKPPKRPHPDKKRPRSAITATPNSTSSSSSPPKKAKRIDRKGWDHAYFSDPTIHHFTHADLEAHALWPLKLGQGHQKHFIYIVDEPIQDSRFVVSCFRLPFEGSWDGGKQLIKSTPLAKNVRCFCLLETSALPVKRRQ
jgi:hypothetical protein